MDSPLLIPLVELTFPWGRNNVKKWSCWAKRDGGISKGLRLGLWRGLDGKVAPLGVFFSPG